MGQTCAWTILGGGCQEYLTDYLAKVKTRIKLIFSLKVRLYGREERKSYCVSIGGMTNEEEIIALLRQIADTQQKSLAARNKNMRFVNWVMLPILLGLLVLLYFILHPAR